MIYNKNETKIIKQNIEPNKNVNKQIKAENCKEINDENDENHSKIKMLSNHK